MRFAAIFSTLLSLLAPAAPVIHFVEAEAAAGIAHVHHKPILDPKLAPIMPWMTAIGAAAAAGDFNKDGWIDLYLTDSQQGKPNRLYRNNGNGTFTDVAGPAGVALLNDKDGVSTDGIWGDVDNDGWPDLYVVRWGRDVLLHNNGDGTFRDVTRERFRRQDGSPGTDWKNGAGAIFFDYDLDGRLDLYVGNYFADFDLTRLKTTRVMHDSFEAARNAGHNQLFHQEPDGSFRDVAPALGVDDTGWTLALGAADVDNDGWPDLYVANDFGADKLFLNRRDGTFKDVSVEALGIDTKKGMNVDFGDFNADGWLDVYVTNISTPRYVREGNMLWLNNGVGKNGKLTFTDVGAEAGVAMGGWAWGARFFDADNDGDLDLFCANGFISAGEGDYWPDIVAWRSKPHQPIDALSWPPIGDKSFSGFEPDRFWRNVDRSTFVEEAAAAGLASTRDGRGVVAFDYDNDGDLDLYVANQGQAGQLFRNETSHSGHWLELTLRGAPAAAANRDAVGARITVTLAGARLIRERDGGNGYAGQSDPRVHFGLGDATAVGDLEILWPDGGVQEWTNVAADQDFVVQQDPARYVRPARTTDVAAAIPEGWTTYTDPMGFTVGYPKSLLLLPETGPLPDRRPPLVHRVRFLDRELAAGDTAALEPPQFSVEVFAAPPGPLRPWLEENRRIPKGTGVEVLELPGAREALRIRDPRMLAPNEFSWYATDRYTFLVVALGSEGEAMRKTFRLSGREKGAGR